MTELIIQHRVYTTSAPAAFEHEFIFVSKTDEFSRGGGINLRSARDKS